MSKNSTITVKDFLKDNSTYTRVYVDFVPYFDDEGEMLIDNLTGNETILNKFVDKATIDVVHFHHYQISIITKGLD